MMHVMLQQNVHEDFVVGTGETHTVREFLEVAFGELNLNYQDYLVIDKNFYRPTEVDLLVADPQKAREKLGWKSKMNFEELALQMVRNDYDILKKRDNYWS